MRHVFVKQLLSSGSKALNVNGSSVPVEFTYVATEPVALLSLGINLTDSGNAPLDVFASLATSLSNGLLFEVLLGGTPHTLFNPKDNDDLIHCFPIHHFSNSNQSFGGSSVLFRGRTDFSPANAPHLQLLASDAIRVTVRDNLTGLTNLTVSALLAYDVFTGA